MTTRLIRLREVEFAVQAGTTAQHNRFWNRLDRGTWEPDTFRVIDAHTDAETLAVDCGAWIGPTVLYTAQRAGLCVGFEPDPEAFRVLTGNIALNAGKPWVDRLCVFPEAIHSSGAPVRIKTTGGEGGDSMSSALNLNPKTGWTVQSRRLQDVLKDFRASFRKVFVKIDVEGGEYDILPGIAEIMADEDVALLVSFHHRRLKLALDDRHDRPQDALDERSQILTRVAEALPWHRSIRSIDGTALEQGSVRKAAMAGNSFAVDILID